jgi:hypothetical protein
MTYNLGRREYSFCKKKIELNKAQKKRSDRPRLLFFFSPVRSCQCASRTPDIRQRVLLFSTGRDGIASHHDPNSKRFLPNLCHFLRSTCHEPIFRHMCAHSLFVWTSYPFFFFSPTNRTPWYRHLTYLQII